MLCQLALVTNAFSAKKKLRSVFKQPSKDRILVFDNKENTFLGKPFNAKKLVDVESGMLNITHVKLQCKS